MTDEEDQSNRRDLHAGFAMIGLIMRGQDPFKIPAMAYELADLMQEERAQHRAESAPVKRQTKKEKANE
jgi:hypothetical protein